MDLRDDIFLFGNEVRFVLLIPFDPVSPHLNYLFFFKLSSNTKSCDGLYISVEILFTIQFAVLVFEYGKDFFPVSSNLCKLTISNKERIWG